MSGALPAIRGSKGRASSSDFHPAKGLVAIALAAIIYAPGLKGVSLFLLPRTDYRISHHCVEGWSAVASWHGVAVRELARLVGADARARFVQNIGSLIPNSSPN